MALLFETMAWTRGNLPDGSLVLITDTLRADGSFLVHHLLSRLVGGASRVSRVAPALPADENIPSGSNFKYAANINMEGNSNALILALRDGLPHYVYVSRKLGVHLGDQMKKGSISFMDCVCDPYGAPAMDAVPPDPAGILGSARESSSRACSGERHLRDMFSWVVREATSPGSSARDSTGSAASTALSGSLQSSNIPTANNTQTGFRGHGDASAQPAASGTGQTPGLPSPQGAHGATCVFIDDANALGMIAGSASLAVDFVHYCRTVVPRPSQNARGPPPRCSVVVLVHRDIPEDAPLLNALAHTADLVLHVDALETGHAVDVHGQVTVEHRTSTFLAAAPQQAASIGTPVGKPLVWPLPQRLQYRLYENSCTFFLPGVFRGS